LEKLLIKDRGALKGEHIKKAFKLPLKSGIQKLFVKAAVRPFLEFRDHGGNRDLDDSEAEDEDQELEEQYAIAYGPSKFVFQKEADSIDAFGKALFKEVRATNSRREKEILCTGGRKRKETVTTWHLDPLTGERFTI